MPVTSDFRVLQRQNRQRTWVLLGATFVLLAVIGIVVSVAMGIGIVGAAVLVVVAMALTLVAYRAADGIALASNRAVLADPVEYRQLHNLVEGLCIASGLPKPRVYVVDDPAPNAFATGRTPDRAAVAVTSGLLTKLNRTELEGVIAHELAHIRNYDIRVMTVAVATAGVIALIADVFWRALWWGGVNGGRRNRDRESGSNPIILIGFVVVVVLAPIAAALLRAAVSRSREGLADATAVEFTRNPGGLRAALEKLRDDVTVVRHTSHATSHLWIESPDDQTSGDKGAWFNGLFDTHPPLEERIDVLRAMEFAGVGAAAPQVSADPSQAEPGWYRNPTGSGPEQRWWDGNRWTEHTS